MIKSTLQSGVGPISIGIHQFTVVKLMVFAKHNILKCERRAFFGCSEGVPRHVTPTDLGRLGNRDGKCV